MADSYTRRVVGVLLGLRMLSEGSTYRWDKERTSSSTGDTPIPVRFTASGDIAHEDTPYEHHHHQLRSARSLDELADRLLAAEKALRAAHGHYDAQDGNVPNKPGELRLYVLIDCAGARAVDVASKTGMSVSWVRMIRSKARKHPNTGMPLDVE